MNTNKILIISYFLLLLSCRRSFDCENRINYRIISQEIKGVVAQKYIESGKDYPYFTVNDFKGNRVFWYKQLERDTINSIYARISIGDSLYKRKDGDSIYIYSEKKLKEIYDVKNECPTHNQ